MRAITVSQIAAAVGGKLLCGDPSVEITDVCYDSRLVREGSLFVPIRGERVDAHQFIEACLVKGAATLTEYDAPAQAQKPYIHVEDTRSALQRLAAWYRRQFDVSLIGITGSVGKTSTKEMVAAALSGGLRVMKTQGNQNSQIGLPVTMFGLTETDQAAVIEMGMSQFGEMERLSDIAMPNMAVMTNIGVAHIENLKTQENILQEKFQITKHFQPDSVLFLNGDDPLLSTLHGHQPFRTVTFGFGADCDYRGAAVVSKELQTEFDCITGDRCRRLTIPALGKHSVLNALAAIAVGDALGLNDTQLAQGLASYHNAPMRQQIYQLKELTLIDDSYNASPEAVKVSVDVLQGLKKGRSIAVLADMLELGDQAAEEHFRVGEYLAKAGVDVLIAVGAVSENTAEGAVQNQCPMVFKASDNTQAYEILKGVLEADSAVLIKGSRGMHTDEIVKKLLHDYQEK